MDEQTLTIIRRSNIKLEKYEALGKEFHQASLPLFVDLMLGLPGQTLASLRADFQQCVDREVTAKCHLTELLVNSPMNEPAYRAEHQIVTSRPPGATGTGARNARAIGPAFVVSSTSFTRDDYYEMNNLRRAYMLAENLGVMRPTMRFVRKELGLHELELIDRLRSDLADDPERWPYLDFTLVAGPDAMVPPVSWQFYVDDLRSYLTSHLGIDEGSGLDAVLAVQHAILPAPGRVFPLTLDLKHDYAGWHRSVLEAKDGGHMHDWEQHVPHLAEFPPAAFTVNDPHRISERMLGRKSAIAMCHDWELDSPIARAMPAHYRMAEATV